MAPMTAMSSHFSRTPCVAPCLQSPADVKRATFPLHCCRSRISVVAAAAVRGVLFDMDGVLCDSEQRAREAGVDMFAELGFAIKPEDFIPFTGTGDANFLQGVANAYGVPDFSVSAAKQRFHEIFIEKYARPNTGLGFPGALEFVKLCKESGLKLALASSADKKKVNASLVALGFPDDVFDAVLSADAFERLKPAPDVFLAASKAIGVPPDECVVVEDAIAGVEAALAAGMRCIALATTVSKEQLEKAGPTLIRKSITEMTMSDILNVASTTVGVLVSTLS